jgi:hypothetical protein
MCSIKVLSYLLLLYDLHNSPASALRSWYKADTNLHREAPLSLTIQDIEKLCPDVNRLSLRQETHTILVKPGTSTSSNTANLTCVVVPMSAKTDRVVKKSLHMPCDSSSLKDSSTVYPICIFQRNVDGEPRRVSRRSVPPRC